MSQHRMVAVAAGLFLAVGLWTLASWGQGQPAGGDPNVLEADLKDILEQVGRGEVEPAFARLLTGSHFKVDSAEVVNLIAKAKEIPTKYGKFLKVDRVEATPVAGSSLVFFKFLLKCERLPVVWYFTYYRGTPESPWLLVSVRFDTRLEALAP